MLCRLFVWWIEQARFTQGDDLVLLRLYLERQMKNARDDVRSDEKKWIGLNNEMITRGRTDVKGRDLWTRGQHVFYFSSTIETYFFFLESIYVRHDWDICMNIQPGRKMGIKTKQHCRRRSHWPWREFGECLRKPRANGREILLAFVRVRGKVSTSSRVTSHVIFMLTAYWLNGLTLWLATPNHWSASSITQRPFPFSPISMLPMHSRLCKTSQAASRPCRAHHCLSYTMEWEVRGFKFRYELWYAFWGPRWNMSYIRTSLKMQFERVFLIIIRIYWPSRLERVMGSFLKTLSASWVLSRPCKVAQVPHNVMSMLKMFWLSNCWHQVKVLTE